MDKRPQKRTQCWLTISFLIIWTSSAFASLAKTFQIPSQFGNIKEVFEAQLRPQDTEKTIIHLQDAHCNYEAQKNMAQLLDYLVREYGLKLIMVEGGSGDVNLSFLRSYADKKARQEVAEKYLKLGKISGEEYLDIVSDYQLELYGIEDEALYEAHLDAFHKVDALREDALKYLDDLSRIISALKPHIYREELRYLESAKKNYEEKTLSLGQYCQYLKNIAERRELELKDYPYLSAFAELSRLEKETNFKEAEAQRASFINNLAGGLNEKQVKTVIEKSQQFKSGNITAQEYYSFLKDLAVKRKINLEQNYPQLSAYITYINKNIHINVAELLKELASLEEKIKETLFSTDEQKKLYEITKSLNVLKGLVSLEITPEEYAYFEENRSKFSTASWMDFLTENCNKYNLALRPIASGVIDENLSKFEGFYKLGSDREQAFIKNIVSKMNESGEKLAVFIAGGFHTPNMTQMFKDRGYSYVVVTPTITKKTDSSIYLSVLRGERKNPESDNIDRDEE